MFALHGTPGSRVLYPPHVEDARKRGIRLIGFSRPGYGGSSRTPGRSVFDVGRAMSLLADGLDLEKFAVWGHSGGGQYALAAAAALPKRVVGTASLSTLAPYGAEGLDWFAGMGDYNVEDIKLMMSDRPEWEEKSKQDADVMARGTTEDLFKMLSSLLSDVDRKVLTEEFTEFLKEQSKEGFRLGVGGYIDDGLADGRPWGFDPATIKVPVQVWHGRHDRFCPVAHGEWLAQHIPNVEAHIEDGDGHATMFVNRIPEVHRWLASKF